MISRRGLSDKTALDLVGGIKSSYKKDSVMYYLLNDGRKAVMKYSKLHKSGVAYWFGITPHSLEALESEGVTNYIFILGYEGIINLPIKALYSYIKNADITYKDALHIKHYHVRIKYDERIILYNKVEQIDLQLFYFYDELLVYDELKNKSRIEILEEVKSFEDYEVQYRQSENISKIRKESKAQKERIALLEDHKCQVCQFCEEYKNAKGKSSWIIEVDHIIDKSNGGGERYDNLWVLCPNCHEMKTRGIIDIDPTKKEVRKRNIIVKINDNHLGWNKV